MPDPVINCEHCGSEMSEIEVTLGLASHPGCMVIDVPDTSIELATVQFGTLDPRNPAVPLPDLAADLQAEFITMIRWYEEASPRTRQVSLGPSDIGDECDRSLGYKIAGIRGTHKGDPWGAWVGTAMHHRMEKVVKAYQKAHGGVWMIEGEVIVDPLVRGHADYIRTPVLVDLKSVSPDGMDRVKKKGLPPKYLVQGNLYAKGLNQMGIPIESIAFIFMPKAGKLDNFYTWAGAHDPQIADDALARTYGIARKLTELDILAHPQRWEEIEPNHGYLCEWCPMFNTHMNADESATDKGCAGYHLRKRNKK